MRTRRIDVLSEQSTAPHAFVSAATHGYLLFGHWDLFVVGVENVVDVLRQIYIRHRNLHGQADVGTHFEKRRVDKGLTLVRVFEYDTKTLSLHSSERLYRVYVAMGTWAPT